MTAKGLLKAGLVLALIAIVPGGWIVLGLLLLWDSPRR